MAKVIGRLFDKWAIGRQRKDLKTFVRSLRRMDDAKVGFVVASAADFRHRLMEQHGIDLSDPAKAAAENSTLMFDFTKEAFTLQRKKKVQEAAVLGVWVHSLRVALRSELRELGREMWAELERGFPHVEKAVADFKEQFGTEMQIEGADDFPAGMTPRPKDGED